MNLGKKGGWKLVRTVVSDHKIEVYIELKVALLNSTDPVTPIDMSAFGRAVEWSVKLCYEVGFFDTDNRLSMLLVAADDGSHGLPPGQLSVAARFVQVHVVVVWRVIGGYQKLAGEHLIQIMNDEAMDGLYGDSKIRGSKVRIAAWAVPSILSRSDRNTVPHELGHSLGLLHPDENYHVLKFLGFRSRQYWRPEKQLTDTNNLMLSGGSQFMNDSLSVNLVPEQVGRIIKNLKKNKVNK